MRASIDHSSDKVDKWIDLKRLRYFIAVCDHGGISKAASAIGIAQPALTRQIKILEAQVGRPLINRSGRGVEPSRPGRYILDRSREHISSLDSLLAGVRTAFPIAQEPFVLGICPVLASLLLDGVAEHITNEHLHIALSVVQASSGDLASLLRCGRLDMALTYRVADADDATFEDLLAERYRLVRIGDRATRERHWSLKDVAGLKLVLPSRVNEARTVIDRICDRRRIRLRPSIELDSIEAVVLMLSQDGCDYASILPYFSVSRLGERLDFRCDEIDEPSMQRHIGILSPREPRNSKTLEVISKRVREAVGRLQI